MDKQQSIHPRHSLFVGSRPIFGDASAGHDLMTIACLGWGSLVWDPRDLPVTSAWHSDGPSLPIEFARQSNDGRISLVLTDAAEKVQVLWCALKSDTAEQAFAALVDREGITARDPSRVIGLWKKGDKPRDPVGATVSEWATLKSIDAVTWTALGVKFAGQDRSPSADEVVRYLKTLDGERRKRAEEYVRRAPAQIRTRYRTAIEDELGWTLTSSVR